MNDFQLFRAQFLCLGNRHPEAGVQHPRHVVFDSAVAAEIHDVQIVEAMFRTGAGDAVHNHVAELEKPVFRSLKAFEFH